ncbi:MAG: ATP-binding cassette domain-containing protein [Candidatus Gracilibacteria bacterium]|jgi:cell division transport system ATP-binding protein|nr:ATP-binding cassette domain-containing protein [Candidatus Gracilibacteria bacterium]
MIRFKNVSKSFGIANVLDDISFDIQKGECVAITGESGSGKSTLIHMLIGAARPSNGAVQIDNFHIERLSTDNLQLFRRSIGVVFQDFKLLEKKTVFENVAFALEALDETDEEIYVRTNSAISKVGLQGKEHRFPHELSGGEKQRTAIARAIVHNPHVIIADEPTGNLDQKNSLEVINLLKKLNQDGITVIIATHSNEVLDILKPRIITIKNHKITETRQKPHISTVKKINLKELTK